jgi:hypothetical protein
MYKKVENNPSYVRDMYNKGLVNVDNNALDAYRRQRDHTNSQRAEISNMCDDINNIKQEMLDIKKMLVALLDK